MKYQMARRFPVCALIEDAHYLAFFDLAAECIYGRKCTAQ